MPQYGLMKGLLNSLLRDKKLELAKEIWVHTLFAKKHVKEACSCCLDMMEEAGLMPQPNTFATLMKGLKKLYNRAVVAEITDKVREMVAERNVSFKMYKRRGVVCCAPCLRKPKTTQ